MLLFDAVSIDRDNIWYYADNYPVFCVNRRCNGHVNMVHIKLTKLLNHYTLLHFERLAQLDPEAIIEVNEGVAEQVLFEIQQKCNKNP